MYNLKSSVAALVLLGQGIAAQNSSWDHSLYTSSPGVFPSRMSGQAQVYSLY
jgi:beta-glucosidase